MEWGWRVGSTQHTQWQEGVHRPGGVGTVSAASSLLVLVPVRRGACVPQTWNMSWNKVASLPKEWYFMHWLSSFKIDNNCLTEFSEDIGIMQGLRQFWFGMNLLTRWRILHPQPTCAAVACVLCA